MGINSADLYNATEMVNNTIIYNRTKTKDRRLDKSAELMPIKQNDRIKQSLAKL